MSLEKTDWDKYDYKESFLGNVFLNSMWKGYMKLLSNVKLKKGLKILELGSGTAFNSFKLAKEFNASKVTLVDSNKEALVTGKKRFGNRFNVKLVKKNVFDVKFNEKYDLVHSQGLIEHFQGNDLKRILKVHSNLVKKNGLIIIFYPTKTFMYLVAKKFMELVGKWIFSDEVPLKKEQVINLMGKSVKLIDSVKVLPYWLTEEGVLLRKN